MRRSGYARCEAWKSHDLGLQVSHRVDHEVPISGDGRRCGAEGPRTATRNCAGSRDEDLCRVDQSGSCAYADWDTTASVGVTSGAIPQGEKLAQTSVGISIASQKILGPTSLEAGILGRYQATSLTRYGRNTLRIRSRRFRMIISTWYSESALVAD